MRFRNLSLLLCLTVGVLIYAGSFGLLEDAENRLLDMKFRLRGQTEVDSRIVIAGIDQETLAWAARPLFAWGPLYGELAQTVGQAAASLLLLDLIFSPGSESAIREHVKEISARLQLELPQKFYREIGFDKPFRSALMEMTASGTALVAGFAWENDQPVFSDPALLHIAKKANTGYFNLAGSSDGVIRSLELSGQSENGPVYAVSMVAAMRSGFYDNKIISDLTKKQINFRGPRKNVRTISVKDIIEASRTGKPLTKALQNKIVLLGFTDITDFKATPFGFMPGVEVHANVIDNILNNRFLTQLKTEYELAMVAIILICLLITASKKRLAAIASGAIITTLWLTLSLFWFDPTFIPTVKPVLLLMLFVASESFVAYRAVYLDRQRVRNVFSRYVSDAVLKEILASNDRDFMQGKRRQLCIMIVDIRGFTSFSEQHDAHEIVKFLNSYFARLTEIIMNNRGVVDKFLGDGLLAFFNAPVETPDAANNAVKAAQQIIKYTNSPEFKAICLGAELKAGLAVHAGTTVFGNIGSARKTEFTVIGDTVNTCSRMESLNKEYKTSTILSGELIKSVTIDVNCKFLDKLCLRGKSEEIEIYTIDNPEE